MLKKAPYKILLDENKIPEHYYNMVADMKERPAPMLNPATHKPAKEEELYPIFAKELARQELSAERYFEIPEKVRDYYKMYRPAPVFRAYQLEKLLDTPARIYYKYEGNNTSGSHKLNSAIAQAYYNKVEGIRDITTETGAGQWGTALAMACSFFDLNLLVYMVKVSAMQKPHRKAVMETFGAKVLHSPSETTRVGRMILKDDPNCAGSLGTAIGEAVEKATTSDNTRYTLGSVLNQVLLHQSVIGQEAKLQLESVDEYPDIIIGCSGGGSNLGGIMAPFMQDRLTGKAKPYFIAVEPAACPSLTRGKYAYDYCDAGQITPLAKMYTLGSGFIPASVHSGGLRYHGMSPVLSKLYHDGFIDEARAVTQTKVFEAAVAFSKAEGILPAPESAHAIRATIEEAQKCRESGTAKTILFCLSGHGHFDLSSYMQFNEGNMVEYIPTNEDLQCGFDTLPKIRE